MIYNYCCYQESIQYRLLLRLVKKIIVYDEQLKNQNSIATVLLLFSA
jgi:hypothetical protein